MVPTIVSCLRPLSGEGGEGARALYFVTSNSFQALQLKYLVLDEDEDMKVCYRDMWKLRPAPTMGEDQTGLVNHPATSGRQL